MPKPTVGYILFLVALLFASSSASGRSDSFPSGMTVYSRAIDAMRHTPIPHYITYKLTTVHHGMDLRFNIRNDPSRRFLGAQPIFDAHEFSTIDDVRYDSWTGDGAVFTLKGTPVLTCAFFPLAPEVRAFVQTGTDIRVSSSAAPSPSPSPSSDHESLSSPDMFREIAKISVFYSKYYSIVNTGIEQLGDAHVFHLQLTAKDGDTSDHPVTDVLVDTKSYLIRSITFGGGQRGLITGGGGYGRFDFTSVRGYWLVHKIHVEIAGHLFFIHKGGSLDYTFSHFAFPTQMAPPF